MQKLLFYQWNAFMQKGIEKSLKRLKIEYDVFFCVATDWDKDDDLAKKLETKLNCGEYQAVFSVNFMPVISDVCMKLGIKYISWVYDSPLHIRRVETLMNSCNTIYFFDRVQAETYLKNGVTGARHLPLAADPQVFNCSIPASNEDYLCDVSLLGQLYQSEYAYLCSPLSMYNRGCLEGIVRSQMQISGGFIVDELLNETFIDNLNKEFLAESKNLFKVSKEELSYTLAKEVTGRQRFAALSLLESRCRVNLYSKDVDKRLQNINNCGYVDYYNAMPEVFAKSRINLNISLCTIQSGIPLRVLDIMACKGFVLTNMQPELFEYFTPGEDLVVYEDMKDLVVKALFYLEHEAERKRIAENGYKKVCELFTFDDRMKKILDIM